MNRFITMLLLATAVCTATGSVSAQEADRILGIYKVEGETTHELSKVRIYKTGDTYEARIIWLEHPNDEAGIPGSTCSIPTRHCGAAGPTPLYSCAVCVTMRKRSGGRAVRYTTPSMAKCTTYRRNSMVRRSSGSGGISESPCSAETSSGKSWSNAYRPTNGKRRGTARGTPSLIFPAESTASSPGHDTLTAHAHAAWEQQRTECAEPNAKETATKSTVHSGPSLLHRQYRPDPRQAHPFRPTPA